jgi:hypothetical protein
MGIVMGDAASARQVLDDTLAYISRQIRSEAQLAKLLDKLDGAATELIDNWNVEHCLADGPDGRPCGYRLEDPSDEHCPEHRSGDDGWD